MNRLHVFYAAVLLIFAGIFVARSNGQATQPPPATTGRYTMWADAGNAAGGQRATVFVLDTTTGTVWMREASSARVTTFLEVPR